MRWLNFPRRPSPLRPAGVTFVKSGKSEEAKMLRCAALLLFTLTLGPLTLNAHAQPTALNEQQRMGQLLVSQSCGVCHFKPQIIASTFGPCVR
jgi:hypothetical protein